MIILMPLTAKEEDGGELVKISDAKIWGIFDLQEGKVQSIQYFENRHEFKEWIDVVVVTSKYDDIWQFQEESIPVLEAPVQRTIEDVIEAFIFKELYDIAH